MKIILVSRCSWTLFNFRAGLMRSLKGAGHDVVGGGAGEDGFARKIAELGVPFVSLPVDKNGLNFLSDLNLFRTLFQWYRRERPAIVHHFTIKPVIYGSMAARLAGVPKIINTVTGLGYVFTNGNTVALRHLVQILYRVSMKSAHFNFFQNQEDLEFFVGKGLTDPERAGLLPGSGVDCEFFSPVNSNRKPGPTCIFLMVSRLLRDKGIYEFVEAARKVKKSYPATSFWVLGKRDERNPSVVPLDECRRWEVEGTVRWLGEASDVRPIMAKADVIVLPSYREGTPRSLLEAAAMGKPLITTDSVGCRDTVEDGVTGLLVSVKDSNSLASAMIKMINEPETRVRMGEAGRRKAMRQFDEKRVIGKIFDIYASEVI